MRLRAKPIPMRSAAPDSGRVTTLSHARRSTPMPIPNRRASVTARYRRARTSTQAGASSSCRTTRSVPPATPTPCCSISCRAPTKPPPRPEAGIARRWNARWVFQGGDDRSELGAGVGLVPWYTGTNVPKAENPIEIERVQTGVRMERRILKVLKALAEFKNMTLGDLLEGIVLHAFEGKPPFSAETLRKISELKRIYD